MAKRTTTKRSSAVKNTGSKTARTAARGSGSKTGAASSRSTSKTASKRSTTGKGATAKKAAGRSAAKKSGAKKAAPKKAAPKKAAAKKSTAKGAAGTKATRTAKRPAARKAVTKKTAARASAVKKATPPAARQPALSRSPKQIAAVGGSAGGRYSAGARPTKKTGTGSGSTGAGAKTAAVPKSAPPTVRVPTSMRKGAAKATGGHTATSETRTIDRGTTTARSAKRNGGTRVGATPVPVPSRSTGSPMTVVSRDTPRTADGTANRPAPAAMPVKHGKEKVQIEFIVRSTPNMLYELISTPSGFSEWYCDDVNVRGDEYTFIWQGEEEATTMIGRKLGEVIRFRRNDDEDENSYFEFRVRIDPMTNEVALIVTDHAWPDEVEETRSLWTSQIQNLLRVLGA